MAKPRAAQERALEAGLQRRRDEGPELWLVNQSMGELTRKAVSRRILT